MADTVGEVEFRSGAPALLGGLDMLEFVRVMLEVTVSFMDWPVLCDCWFCC